MVVLAAISAAGRGQAQVQVFKDWTVLATGGDTISAVTRNDSGRVLGIFCTSAGCIWVVTAGMQCSEGSEYTVLINADAGATPTETDCVRVDGSTWGLRFQDAQVLETALATSTRVGIAVPLASGAFHVVRFSMAGGEQAVAFLRANLSSAEGPKSPEPAMLDEDI
jgi:hypothetical protein